MHRHPSSADQLPQPSNQQTNYPSQLTTPQPTNQPITPYNEPNDTKPTVLTKPTTSMQPATTVYQAQSSHKS